MDLQDNLNSEPNKRVSKSIEIQEEKENAKFIKCGCVYRKDYKIPLALIMVNNFKKE